MFKTSKKEAFSKNSHQAMLIGTGLDTIPLVARNRLMRVAEGFGYDETDFTTRKQCRILAGALKATRDRLQSEQKTTGLDELDRCMHRLCSWLGVSPQDL